MVYCIQYIVCSDDFHSPTRDSPKKARAKEPSTPSKTLKSARQLVFDAAVYVPVSLAKFNEPIYSFSSNAVARPPTEKAKTPSSSKSPSKAVSQ